MSEEEKEAIEFLKADNEKAYNKKSLTVETTYNVVDIVLNYIDKLQKENEDMREELQMYVDTDVMKLQKENEELKSKTYRAIINDKGEVELVFDNYIRKDKIRTKIEELEELFDKNEKKITIQYQNQFIVDVVGVLEELLGDDE